MNPLQEAAARLATDISDEFTATRRLAALIASSPAGVDGNVTVSNEDWMLAMMQGVFEIELRLHALETP